MNEKISIALDLIDGDEEGDVGNIMKDVTKLLEVSEKIPKAIDTINSLEEKVKKNKLTKHRFVVVELKECLKTNGKNKI